VSLIEVGLSY